jgi:hypothetical protein
MRLDGTAQVMPLGDTSVTGHGTELSKNLHPTVMESTGVTFDTHPRIFMLILALYRG